MNNGQDPALSDNPQEAIFRIAFDAEQPFADANILLYQIVETYEEFLQERAAVEQIDVKQAKNKYPLNLRFARKPPLMPPQPIIVEEDLKQLEGELK